MVVTGVVGGGVGVELLLLRTTLARRGLEQGMVFDAGVVTMLCCFHARGESVSSSASIVALAAVLVAVEVHVVKEERLYCCLDILQVLPPPSSTLGNVSIDVCYFDGPCHWLWPLLFANGIGVLVVAMH